MDGRIDESVLRLLVGDEKNLASRPYPEIAVPAKRELDVDGLPGLCQFERVKVASLAAKLANEVMLARRQLEVERWKTRVLEKQLLANCQKTAWQPDYGVGVTSYQAIAAAASYSGSTKSLLKAFARLAVFEVCGCASNLNELEAFAEEALLDAYMYRTAPHPFSLEQEIEMLKTKLRERGSATPTKRRPDERP